MYCKYHILNMNFAMKKNLCLEERGAEGRLKLPVSSSQLRRHTKLD